MQCCSGTSVKHLQFLNDPLLIYSVLFNLTRLLLNEHVLIYKLQKVIKKTSLKHLFGPLG